jgi:hypothetical protein
VELTLADRDELRRLEESLWRSETRFDLAHMEWLLAPDFVEFGRSGRTYDRAACLAVEACDIKASLPLPEFRVNALDADTALVTYVSVVRHDEVLRANRASVWSRTPGGWQLRFHQGTPRADA